MELPGRGNGGGVYAFWGLGEGWTLVAVVSLVGKGR